MNYLQSQKFLLAWSKLGRKEYLDNPKECSIYLERLQFFLDLIGNPENKIPHYIHVTGTSGKGSVCLMLDSILRSARHRVGTLTSPDAGLIQTRWQINGKLMPKNEFAKILTELKPKLAEYQKISPYDPISYFELLTAIGLYWFAKKKIDWCVLEVGLGGRYDSTNVIPYKDVAVITNIGLDHEELIGPTKEKIAYEKSGIIKSGCKVFTMEQDKKILKIFEKEMSLRGAKRRSNPLGLPRPSFHSGLAMTGINFTYQNHPYKIPVLGNHQIKNAILCIEIARALKIPYSVIKRGLKKVKLPLRMEIISKKPLIILDGAHNPDKMETTIATMTKIRRSENQKINLVVGFSADKNINKMIKQLITLKPQTIAITKFHSHFKKCAEIKKVEKIFGRYIPARRIGGKNIKIKTFSNPKDALAWSKKQNKKNGILLVTGSIYLSGELRTMFYSVSLAP